MKKLIDGIVEFRRTAQPEYRERFAKLALGQRPDSLFIACSDSRVVPNLFASTEPGDLFVVRNVGNLVPPPGTSESAGAAAYLDFSVGRLSVRDIIVCGHSECGAMQAISEGVGTVPEPGLRSWLAHGEPALSRLEGASRDHNALSRVNVLQQLAHLRLYPAVAAALERGKLSLHAWWFDIATANVYAYDAEAGGFVLIDEAEAPRLLERLDRV